MYFLFLEHTWIPLKSQLFTYVFFSQRTNVLISFLHSSKYFFFCFNCAFPNSLSSKSLFFFSYLNNPLIWIPCNTLLMSLVYSSVEGFPPSVCQGSMIVLNHFSVFIWNSLNFLKIYTLILHLNNWQWQVWGGGFLKPYFVYYEVIVPWEFLAFINVWCHWRMKFIYSKDHYLALL